MENSYNLQNNQSIPFDDSNDVINISQIFSTLSRNIKLISAFSGVALIAGFLYSKSLPPVWQGQFQIVLKADSGKGGLSSYAGGGVLGLVSKDSKSINTEVTILKSPSVLKPVYTFLKNEKSKNGIDTSGWTYSSWVNSQLDIKLIRETSVLEIKYNDADKDIILPVLSKMSNIYKQYSGSERNEALNAAVDYLNDSVNNMTEITNISLQKLQDFSLKHKLGSQDGVPAAMGNSIITEINQSGQQNGEINPVLLPRDPDRSEGVNRYSSHFRDLTALEAVLLQKSTHYREDSSVIKSLKSRIENLRNSLERPKEVLFKYRKLRREAIRNEQILHQLENQLSVTKLDQAKQRNPWKLISTPTVLDEPISTKSEIVALLGLLGGFVFGAAFSVIKEVSSGVVFEPSQVKSKLRFPLLVGLKLDSLSSWDESLQLCAEGICKTEGNKSLGVIALCDSSTSHFQLFRNKFSSYIGNSKLIISDKISELRNTSNNLILIIEGETTYEDLSIINQEIAISNTNVIGWIFIGKTITL